MKLILSLLLILSIQNISNSQSLANIKFSWKHLNYCKIGEPGKCTPLWITVFEKPIITSLTKSELEEKIKALSKKLELEDDVNGILKIKFIIPINSSLCVQEIGQKTTNLQNSEIDVLAKWFNSIIDFIPGKHKGDEVNSQGLLYLIIENGKIISFKHKRILLADESPAYNKL